MWMAVFAAICFFVLPEIGWAADAGSSGGYLAGYENADPKPTSVSWWSTLAYLLSLLVIFAFVLAMAYFVAKLLGGRFGRSSAKSGGRMLLQLPLGPKSSACIVELAGRTFLLGVTEHNVSLLAEITDREEIEALERSSAVLPERWDSTLFSSQLGALSDLVSRFRK